MQNILGRPTVLTIAGFDPSNGAGFTADVKTLEEIHAYALSVCTANTIQNDQEFKACYWTPFNVIKEQLSVLMNRFEIDFVKIGIVENFTVLSQIIEELKQHRPLIKIVLDPVLKSSSEFTFHIPDDSVLDEVMGKIHLITPNYDEIRLLYPTLTIEETIVRLQQNTHVFLKGGHREEHLGLDELYLKNGTTISFDPSQGTFYEKHGSGCVLSSAITGFLAHGLDLPEACRKGKYYTEKILKSNPCLLGYHSA